MARSMIMLSRPVPNEILRGAVKADAADLAAIHFEARRTATPWVREAFTHAEVLWYFRNVVVEKMAVSVVAVDDRPVAFVADTRGWVEHLYVGPEHWRQGFGTRLLRTVQERQDDLQLWTFKGNRAARTFYAVNGFDTVEITDGSRNAEKEADVRLVWRRGGRLAAFGQRGGLTIVRADRQTA